MSHPRFRADPVKEPRTESGAALLAFLLVLLVGGSYALLNDAKSLAQRAKLEESRKTSEALAKAKAALTGYAVSADILPDASCLGRCRRPGDLPCPDRNNDGSADTPCDNADERIGRLPRKQLGIPDLRDGSGERLWYAVSTNFKNNKRTFCDDPTDAACLNSRTRGTITVRERTSTGLRHNGNDPRDSLSPTGAIAVILAPGPTLSRQGTSASQNRVCSNCSVTQKCLGIPPTTVPRCDPENYLDRRQTPFPSEDNADFSDSSSTDGFIEGPVYDSEGNLIINDRLAVITYYDIMPLLEQRVVGEVSTCLVAYSAANLNRYPWAAALTPGAPPAYDDDSVSDDRFGRVPDGFPDSGVDWATTTPPSPTEQFTATNTDSGTMAKSWPLSQCSIISTKSKNTWWLNWKEEVFYAVSDAFKPAATAAPEPSDDSACAAPFACLTLGSSTPPSKRFLVIAAGKRLVGQIETLNDNARKGNIANYLELENTTFVPNVDETFTSGRVTASFDDVVGYFAKP